MQSPEQVASANDSRDPADPASAHPGFDCVGVQRAVLTAKNQGGHRATNHEQHGNRQANPFVTKIPGLRD
jgi:hypothetical protein